MPNNHLSHQHPTSLFQCALKVSKLMFWRVWVHQVMWIDTEIEWEADHLICFKDFIIMLMMHFVFGKCFYFQVSLLFFFFFKFVYCSQVQIHILRHHKQQLKQHKHHQQQQHRDRVSLQRFLRLHQIVLTPLWVWLCVSLWLVFYWWLFSSCSSTFIRQGGTLHWTSEKMQATKTWRWVSVTCLLSVYTGFSDYCLITVMFLMKCSEKWIFFF